MRHHHIDADECSFFSPLLQNSNEESQFFQRKKKSPHGKVQSKKSGKETNKQRKTSPQ